MENPIMTLTMEDGGKIVAELYPEKAPQSVRNFISLANKGFYDGLIFHRVISGFMIQGGCPQGTGMGGPGYCIKGEFKLNGVKNNLSHKRGVLSMARAQSPNSAGSQFFIMHEDGEFLDGQYAAFGKVLEGMDVVDKIAAVKTDGNDRPLSEQKNRLDPRRHEGRGISPNPTSSATRMADFNIKKAFPGVGNPRRTRGCTGFDGGSEAG